jgi:hypothetical protein
MSIYKKDGVWVALESKTSIVIGRSKSLSKLMRIVAGG